MLSSILTWVFIIALAYYLWKRHKIKQKMAQPAAPPDWVKTPDDYGKWREEVRAYESYQRDLAGKSLCKTCGWMGKPRTETKGHFAIEVVLWLCFIVPGLIYSLWRLGSNYDACPLCKSTLLVPASSPAGRKLLDEYGQRPGR